MDRHFRSRLTISEKKKFMTFFFIYIVGKLFVTTAHNKMCITPEPWGTRTLGCAIAPDHGIIITCCRKLCKRDEQSTNKVRSSFEQKYFIDVRI